MNSIGVGVDIERIERFKKPARGKDSKFFHKIYTEPEIDYCFSHAQPYIHLAARYAGKEAIVKALYQIGIKGIFYSDIEIINDKDGVPVVTICKDGYSGLVTKLSMSHTDDNAIAFALVIKS